MIITLTTAKYNSVNIALVIIFLIVILMYLWSPTTVHQLLLYFL